MKSSWIKEFTPSQFSEWLGETSRVSSLKLISDTVNHQFHYDISVENNFIIVEISSVVKKRKKQPESIGRMF